VIENERQYQVTLEQMEKLERAIQSLAIYLKDAPEGSSPLFQKSLEGLNSMLFDLTHEVQLYEDLIITSQVEFCCDETPPQSGFITYQSLDELNPF
jgi:hypothetical protein